MATPAYPRASAVYSNLDKAAAIALVLKASMDRKRPENDWPYIKDISRVLYDLRGRGFRFKNLGLRPIPGGYYSEDVEIFLGQLLSMGYASQRSPIRLEAKGEGLCDEILVAEGKSKGDELKRLAEEVNDLLSRAPVAS